jgi:hypothetical protein
VREECGIEVRSGRLACVDFRPGRPGHPGGIQFLFDCGPADDAVLAAIKIQPEEIAEYRLVPLDAAFDLFRPPIRRRVRAVSRHRGFVYLEDGRTVSGISWPWHRSYPHTLRPSSIIHLSCADRRSLTTSGSLNAG